jgi:two-component system, OmpR family, phosphate regulon sensor histidine kinase PhoR
MTTVPVVLGAALAGAAVIALWFRRRWQQSERQRVIEIRAERERHEVAEHALQARMEAMLDGMIEGLLVLDANGRIALANRAAEQMFQFSRMMVGGTVLETLRNREVAALASRAATAGHAIEHEVRLEGTAPRILQISAVALHDASGTVAGAVLVFHDVTRLRQLEAMRQDFVANVSHELRTPLSLIKSAAETLLDSGAREPALTARFLEIIDKHASRLTLLIDDLLLLGRLDSGQVKLDLQPVAMRVAAQEAIDDCAVRANARQISLENRVPPEVVAHADPDRVQQVLGNLIENAIKYGRTDGRVVVLGRVVDGQRVELSVRDDGPGIPPDAQLRIFERFYRVDKGRSREQGGTGLGLAIVKNVVHAHGGEVRVESTLGAGAEFFITLPRDAAPINDPPN